MRLSVNDIDYILMESKRLLLTEISNDAIETLFKKYMPDVTPFMNLTIGGLYHGTEIDGATNGRWILYSLRIGSLEIEKYHTMKLKDYFRLSLMKEFEINRGRGPMKYMRGIIRICCDVNGNICYFEDTYFSRKNLSIFKQILFYIMNNDINLDGDFNGLSFNELNNTVGRQMRSNNYISWYNRRKENKGNNVYGDYTVVPINSFHEAEKYGKYTTWCVTQGFDHYNAYTSDDSQFFFCLKKGFEEIYQEEGENCPLDEYGLSMVSVLIQTDGTPKYITTRWNHTFDGENNPQLHTLEQVEEVLGIPKEIFVSDIKPHIDFEDIPDIIKNGNNIDLSELFDVKREYDNGLKVVEYRNKFNVVKDNQLLSDTWYVEMLDIEKNVLKGSSSINRVYYENIFDGQGKVFPSDIQGKLSTFDNKRQLYKLYPYGIGKINLLKRGSIEPLLPINIDNITIFINGLALVYDNKKINFIDENFNFLWDEWQNFNVAYDRYTPKRWACGYAIVLNEYGEENYLNMKTCELIGEQWYKTCEPFSKGFGIVKDKANRYNVLKTDGTFVSKRWWDGLSTINYEYFNVKINDKGFTFMDTNGDFPIKKWFHETRFFDGKWGSVINNQGEYEVIDHNGNTVFKTNKPCVGVYPNNLFLLFDSENVAFVLVDKTGKLAGPEKLTLSTHDNVTGDNVAVFRDKDNPEQKYMFNTLSGELIKL